MFTFIIQSLNVIYFGIIGSFFLYYGLYWFVYLIKLLKAFGYEANYKTPVLGNYKHTVYAIVPTYNEKPYVLAACIKSLLRSLRGLKYKIIIVPNGNTAQEEAAFCNNVVNDYVRQFGVNSNVEILVQPYSGKRQAIYNAMRLIDKRNKGICFILDSDTVVNKTAIKRLIASFSDTRVGGATPRHRIASYESNIWRRVSNWLEDLRFSELLSGQSNCKHPQVSCLPGRLLAIRLELLKDYVDGLISETFLGDACDSGDDRYLTNRLLVDGYKTVYVPNANVYTDCPNTFEGFAKQRLRWSRSSLRESILSLKWSYRYPYLFFTTWSQYIVKYFFLYVILSFIFRALTGSFGPSVIDWNPFAVLLCIIVGFITSGFLKNLVHLIEHPEDIKYLVPYLLITTFVLAPVEIWGNLTIKKSNWMTR